MLPMMQTETVSRIIGRSVFPGLLFRQLSHVFSGRGPDG